MRIYFIKYTTEFEYHYSINYILLDDHNNNEYIASYSFTDFKNTSDKFVEFSSLYVSEKYRNKGIATMIVKSLMYDERFDVISLYVNKFNRVAYNLYIKYGFVDRMEESDGMRHLILNKNNII